MKEGLSSSRKADTTHIRRSFQIYTCRPCEYGADKYERANFMRPAAPVDVDMDVQMRAAFERLRKYLRATRDHIDECLESMERHQSQDPKLVDVEGMKQAAYAMDTDVTPGSKIGASLLPHVAPACSSLMMAITQATDAGLLPKDPGTPWRTVPAVVKDTLRDLAESMTYVQMEKGVDGMIRPVESPLENALTALVAPPVFK